MNATIVLFINPLFVTSTLRILFVFAVLGFVSLSACQDVEKTFYIENKSNHTVVMVLNDPICEQFKTLKSLQVNGKVSLAPGFDTLFTLGPGGWDDRTERFDLRDCIDSALQPLPGDGEGGVGETPKYFMNQYGIKDHELKLIFE